MQNEYRIIKTKYKFEHHAVKSNTRHCLQFSRQHGICFEKNLSPKLLLSIQKNDQPIVIIMKMAAIFNYSWPSCIVILQAVDFICRITGTIITYYYGWMGKTQNVNDISTVISNVCIVRR